MKIKEKIFGYIREHPLISIFTLAVLVRVLLVLFFPLPDYSGGDFALYQRIADSIISQGDLGGEPQKTYGSPSINPGWSFFLAGFFILFGKSQVALLTASILFGGLLAIGTYLLSMQFFNKNTSLLAGGVTAIWPVFLIQTFTYTDSLLFYTVLLLWGILFFIKAVSEERYLLVIISGVLLGFAILVDSIALFIPLIFLLWAFVERLSFDTLKLVTVFLGVCFLVITPWVYRNILVAENMGLDNAPIISKGELSLASPDSLLNISKLVIQDGVIFSGLSKAFIFPFNISILHQRSVSNSDNIKIFSYKEKVKRFIQGESVKWSRKEVVVLSAKIVITLLHWALLGLAVIVFFNIREKRHKKFLFLIAFLLLYVVGASIGYGSLWENDFQGISALSSFLFPLLPFLIIFASSSLLPLLSLSGEGRNLNLKKAVRD